MARAKIGAQADGADPIADKRKLKAATLRVFLDSHYLPWAVANSKTGAGTVERIKTSFAEWLDKPLTDLSGFAIQKWRIARHADKKKPTTTNREIATLRGALSRAIEWGAMPGPHPLKAVKMSKVDPLARVRYLSPAEETRLLAALASRETKIREARASFNTWRTDRGYKPVPDYPAGRYVDHVQPVVLLAMHTGARRGELLGLRWQDVDLTGRMVTFIDTKSDRRTRRVPLNATAAQALTAWRPAKAEPEALVFPGRGKDAPLTTLKTAYNALLKAAAITGFRFHDLRHHAASKLVQAGTDLYVVSEILGHQSMTMTRRYAHLRDTDKADALAKLG
jgi:integrase